MIKKEIYRIEGKDKATGRAIYTGDIKLSGMLIGKILRSKYPHAKILNIDIEKAKKLIGVKGIITCRDLPDVRYGFSLKDQVVLARGKVRYIGEPIAAVAAIDMDIAEEAINLIKIDYEELQPIFDPKIAMKPGSPIIHEELQSYKAIWKGRRYGNICCEARIKVGDIERGFRESDYIFEDSFKTPVVYQAHIEPHVSIALYDTSGGFTIWTSTQAPFFTRMVTSEILKLPMTKIRVIGVNVGGGFGGKAEPIIEPISIKLSEKTNKPVKVEMTREEEFIGTNPRHPAEINIKTGVKKSGNILAREAKLIFDSGAYAGFGPHVASQAATLMGGPYRIPNIKIESYAVYTNNIVGGTCRAPGGPQAHFAVESQMDIIADTLGIDPVEIRIKNAMENGDKTPTGVVISSVSYKKILEELSNSINLKAPKKGEYIGRGIAGYLWGSTGYSSSASIRMNEDGSITLFIGATETGAGSTTTLAIIAAKELSIPFEDITVISGDTDRTPYDMGAIGSRITFTLGKAVRVAALELKSQILTTAAEKLEANIDDLIIEDRNIYVKGSPERSVSLSSIANIIYFVKGTLPTGTGRCIITNPPFDFQSVDGVTVPSKPHYTFGVQGVEIRVDINTGKIEPLRIIAVHDAGKIIFPLGIEGQIEGGIYQGLGFTLCEGGIFKDGRMLNPSFTDYHLLTSVDLPPMELIIMESAPYEVKGAGEPPVLPMAAAVANAIYDAVGVRIKDLPITPEKLFWGIKEKIFINKKIETT